MRVRIVWLLGALWAGLCGFWPPMGAARAAEVTRDGPAVDVAVSVRRSIERIGRELGHGSLQADARLLAAATALAQNARDCGPPARELVEEAMWQSGVVEPSHRLMLVRFAPEAPQDMLAELPNRLPQLLGKRGQSGGNGGKWSRYAFASTPLATGEHCGVLVVLETFVSFAPPKRTLSLGETASYTARLQPPYHKPRALVSPPAGGGDVTPLDITSTGIGAASELHFHFTCAAPGRFLLELLAEDVAGPSVLAKFPCDCGQAPPSLAALAQAQVAESPPPVAVKSVAEAEQQIFELINAERVRAGRSPLQRDARLAAVARAYSEEMHQNQFVAHVSPRTGGPGDRVKRAGIAVTRLAENLVKAPDLRSAHRELMESPGHRAGLLDPLVKTVGIGAALTTSPSGEPWILITELFAVLAPPT